MSDYPMLISNKLHSFRNFGTRKNNKSVDLNDLGRLIIVVIENSYNLKLLK